MKKLISSDLKLGIMAGGQLGKMLIQDASKWNIITHVLDEAEGCPAAGVASLFKKGSRLDYDDVYNFGKNVDVLTFEIESINTEALYKLKSEGVRIAPDPSILELIQDKGKQKTFYSDHGIPTSPFELYESKNDVLQALKDGRLVYPFVQKLRTGGYDGRGVAVIDDENDLDKLLDGPSMVEHKVDIDKEIAIIAARNESGEIRCFPAVEMVFDPESNLVEKLLCPSGIDRETALEAERIASELIEQLNMSGLLAVEFFVDKKQKVLVNEAAPRPHNSGHHTIESVVTSQFEQHLRAILNLPLGSTQLKIPAVMINLVGEKGHEGPVKYEGLKECLAIEGVKVHIYGKTSTRPFRKMGHVTIVARELGDALKKADKVKRILKVKSWDKSA